MGSSARWNAWGGALVCATMLSACAPEAGPWRRLDLCRADHEIAPVGETKRGAGRRTETMADQVWAGLGPVDGGPEEAGSDDLAPTAITRAIRLRAGHQVIFETALGVEPWLSFTPLGAAPDPCPECVREVVVTVSGEAPVSAWRGEVAGATRSSAELERVDVELGRFAQRTVRVALRFTSSDPRARVLWGAPELVWRRPVGAAPEKPPPLPAARPNVLLLGLDTVRADALGAWGRRPSLTPALDRLAEEGDVWLSAYSTFNMTNPSFASILTGQWGRGHGVYDNRSRLDPDLVTLADVFAAAGYSTAAVLAARHLHLAGLDHSFDAAIVPPSHLAGRAVVDAAMSWISDAERPFFAWVHLFDAHTPHGPPGRFALGERPTRPAGLGPARDWEPFREVGPRAWSAPDVGGHRDLYDGEIAYLDRQVDRLLGYLQGEGLLDTTIVAVVGDHGENLEEHGFDFRHQGLWDSTVHVPLIVRRPGVAGGRHRGLAQTMDLFPTLLEAAGIESPPRPAVSLFSAPPRRAVFAELARTHRGQGDMIRTPRWKYFYSRRTHGLDDGWYLYDLLADPGETANLSGGRAQVAHRLHGHLSRWMVARRIASEPVDLSPEDAAELRALGYLD